MAEIRLQGVSKRFGETQAIEGLDLTVAAGEFVVLLGPTGAGKTTTLRLVAGLERPDLGRVFIGGRDMTGAGPAERDVSFVFQAYSLYPHYSVAENLAFPLKAPSRRTPPAEVERRVAEVAKMLRIDHKLKNKATQLSGGEMQRVAIGRALVRQPQVYLMDEPLSSLDAKLREDLRIELKRIQLQLGATILYVTHDQIEAMTLADRVGVLNQGRLEQIGTPREVYGSPDSLYVAQRLGSPAINLVPPGAFDLPSLGVAPPARTATLGLRPEDIALVAGGLPAKVLGVENLGAETVLLLEVGTLRMHALAGSGAPPAPGETVGLALRREALLFFDAEGRRLAPQEVAHVA